MWKVQMYKIGLVLALLSVPLGDCYAAVRLYARATQPPTCNLGDYWVDTDGTAGEKFYVCEATNTWVRQVGYGTTANPSFNSVHASGGNLAAANKQVTKAWQTGLSYTANVTSVIHGGQHYICTSSHTAGASTEPGVGASWATVWAVASGAGDNLGSATYSTVVALWASGSCTGYLKSDGSCDTPSGSATYPGSAGVANWNGSAWGTSYTVGTGASNLVQLNASSQLPAVSAALLTNFPTLNQNTTGTAAGLTAQYIDWNAASGGASIANKPNVVVSGTSGYVFNMGALSDLQYGGNTLIDDTATNGATTRLWSADKVYDELALKAPLTSPGFTTAANPVSADGATLGTASLEWSDLYLASGGVIYGENDQSNTLISSSTGWNLNLPLGLYSANDPDVAAEGKIAWDANGDVLRGYDGTRQVAVARVQKEIQVTVIKPQDLDDAQRDAFFVWSNNSGMSFVVTGWYAWSTSDNTDLNIEETDGDGANNATVDAVSITTDGTGIYYANDSTITAGTIENGHLLWLDFDDTDAPAQVHVTIYGYFNADVN